MTTQSSIEKQRRQQAETRRTAVLMRMYRASKVLLAGCERVGPDVYRIVPADVLALRAFTDEVTALLRHEKE